MVVRPLGTGLFAAGAVNGRMAGYRGLSTSPAGHRYLERVVSKLDHCAALERQQRRVLVAVFGFRSLRYCFLAFSRLCLKQDFSYSVATGRPLINSIRTMRPS